MSVTPLTNSSAVAASASSASPAVSIAPAPPVADVSTPVVSVAGLERTSKIVPLLAVLLGIVLTLAAWYAGQQVNAVKSNETRDMVVRLRDDYNTSERAAAEFRGRTDASLQAIKEALSNDRADQRAYRPR